MNRPCRILIVDDAPDIHDDFRSCLLQGDSSSQYLIDSAMQGQEAVRMVQDTIKKNDPYALIFLDMRMPPGWDGPKTIEEIWKIYPEAEIVICSGYPEDSWAGVIERLGRPDQLLFFKKPFHPIELRQITRALTEKWKLAQAVIERSQELESQRGHSLQAAKLASLGEIAGGIAHEINTPLAVIQLNTEMLQYGLKAKEINIAAAEKSLAVILTAVSKATDVIKSLRKMARSTGNEPFASASPREILNSVLQLGTEKMTMERIRLEKPDIPEGLTIHCNEAEIAQCLFSLLINAREAFAEEKQAEKWIKIGFQDLGSSIAISITDNGKGIDPATRDKIFQPFFTTKPVGKGMGLGLATAKAVMEKHGGTLDYDTSSPNTRFVMTIPKQSRN